VPETVKIGVFDSPGVLAGVLSAIPDGLVGAIVSRVREFDSTRLLTPPREFLSHTLRTIAPFVALTVKLPGRVLEVTQEHPEESVLFSRMQYSLNAPFSAPYTKAKDVEFVGLAFVTVTEARVGRSITLKLTEASTL
jgi:hypothetical protein